MIRVSGDLAAGIEFDGKVHKAFVLRPAIVRDSIEASKEADGKGEIVLMLALLARQIESLGEIPKEKITVELLSGLYDADLGVLQKARESAEKKIQEPRSA